MVHGVRGDLRDSLRSAHFATLVVGAYHGPPLSGSPLLVGQQKNSPPTKNPPTSPLWISANFEAIRKPKRANSRELTGVLLHQSAITLWRVGPTVTGLCNFPLKVHLLLPPLPPLLQVATTHQLSQNGF